MARFDLGHMLQSHVINQPLLITPDRAASLLGIVARELNLQTGRLVQASADASGPPHRPVMLADLAASAPRMSGPRDDRKVYRVVDGVAIIPIEGDLVHKLRTLDPWCGMTGYDGIAFKVSEAVADPDIRGILLDINSRGGTSDGCAACGDAILAARAVKPVWAALSDNAFSAAYWLGAQANRILLPRTGGAGSVGVVTLHADMSRMYDADGVTVTVIHAGRHKADGHSFAPLPAEVLAEWTAKLEALRGQFVAAVAAGRGIDPAAVLATEARCLLADEAIAAGFADEIMNPDDALAAFIAHLAAPSALSGGAGIHSTTGGAGIHSTTGGAGILLKGPHMAETTCDACPHKEKPRDQPPCRDCPDNAEGGTAAADQPPAPAEKAPVCDTCPHKEKPRDQPPCKDCPENPEAAAAPDAAAAPEAAAPDAAKLAADRIQAIMTASEAKGREQMAQHLAFNTTQSAQEAIATLAVAPVANQAGTFAAAMAAFAGPELGAGTDDPAPTAGLSAAVDRMLAAQNQKPIPA
ncbi:MAG: S49 family peptidase [Alphaproteobacteria bacterium]|nr:S49 family peptidase [Alphaproteobacteria bacterium]